jgi:hypothetical protein
MAYSFGRQFRRIAAEAITADREEMSKLIARILPPREDGGARVLQVKSRADCERAPAVIVAAFFADAITGDEAADLLRKTEDPAFRKEPPEDPGNVYGMYGPISLDPEWRRRMGLPPYVPPPASDYPRWGPPLPNVQEVTARLGCSAANGAGELVKNNENTSAPCCDAADNIPEHPPP